MLKFLVLCFSSFVLSASAIVVQTNATAEAAPADLDWSFVYNYKGASGVAVGGNWLLTAAHVGYETNSGNLSIGGKDYIQQEIIFNDDADLALVRYDQPLPGQYSLFTGTLVPAEDPKLSVLMVGYGNTGATAAASWTDGGSGSGTKRWGSQIISLEGSHTTKPDGTTFVMTEGVWMRFNLSDETTVYEAGTGFGDSGGGVFYKDDDNQWKLAGIMTGITPEGGPYIATFAASMPEYAGWIAAQTIPEPAVIGLMSLSTMGLLITRSMHHRKKRIRKRLFPVSRRYQCDSYKAGKVQESSAQKKGREKTCAERWFFER